MTKLAILVALDAVNGLTVRTPAGLLLFWIWHGISGEHSTTRTRECEKKNAGAGQYGARCIEVNVDFDYGRRAAERASLSMKIPSYEIFSGAFDKNAVWIKTVRGLGNAYEQMTKLAAQSPGEYFIFSAKTRRICGSINTASKRERFVSQDENFPQAS
jgi:hypothetical protein